MRVLVQADLPQPHLPGGADLGRSGRKHQKARTESTDYLALDLTPITDWSLSLPHLVCSVIMGTKCHSQHVALLVSSIFS